MSRKKRGTQEINASSMADIAFLLLIFFLVTTTIDVDKGILHKLPAIPEEPPPDVEINDRNTLIVLINARDMLLVDGEVMDVKQLRKTAKEFIDNRGRNPELSDTPRDAVISLQNDRGTSYDIYIQVQNELKAAYRELRDKYSKATYNKTYNELQDSEQLYKKQFGAESPQYEAAKARTRDARNEYPMKLSEAEPKEVEN